MPTLVLFMVFGLPCLILGFLIGRLSAPGKPEPSPEKPEPTKEQVVTTAVTTAAPVITSTEAPPETADPQDLIDDATTRTVYLTFDDGPEEEEVHYTNGTGKFLYKNGELSWQADNDPDVNACVFAR